jgi:hypothetical protein
MVVGPDLSVLSRSMSKQRNAAAELNGLGALLIDNNVAGCTTIVNRALYRRAWPVPPEAVMHDFWLALVASALGHIHYLGTPTILYRQHGQNVMGAPRGGHLRVVGRALQTLFGNSQGRLLERLSDQAEALLARYAGDMSPAQRRASMALANLWSANRWTRFRRLRRAGVRRRGLLRTVALCVTVTRHDAPRRRQARLRGA